MRNTTSIAPSSVKLESENTPLERVMKYQNNAVVQRFMDKIGLNKGEATLLFEDTKRFLYLCGSKQKGDPTLAPPEKVDSGWHEFLLFTEDYQQFCLTFFGRFIHHRPRRLEDPKGGGQVLRNTIALATATFVTLSRNWFVEQAGDSDCNDDCTPSTNCQDAK